MATSAGSILVRVGTDMGGFNRGMSRVQSRLRGFGKFGGAALAGVGVGAVLAGKSMLKAAGDFEQSLNVFEAVSGSTGKQMKQVSQLAKALGKDVELPATSAKDAADAMVELSKGGLSVKDTMAAARPVLQLSAAAQISNAEAAEITADALNAFKLRGEEASTVANLLAASANATTAEIGDMALGLRQSSAVAAQLGIPIQDLTLALSLMANAGIKGSDAGTSIKTMLLSLNPRSKDAAKLINELGVSAFNQAGKFIGLEPVMAKYKAGLKGMSTEQRLAALQTIFGTDAIRAANVIFGAGSKEIGRLKNALDDERAASKLAEAQTKGFKGAIEAFKSNVETLAITLGSKLLPQATKAIGALNKVVDFIGKIADAPNLKVAVTIATSGLKGQLEKLLFGNRDSVATVDMNIQAKIVTTGLVDRIGSELSRVNWDKAAQAAANGIADGFRKGGAVIGPLISALTDGFGKAVRSINWVNVGKEIAQGMATGWKRGFTSAMKDSDLGKSPVLGIEPRKLLDPLGVFGKHGEEKGRELSEGAAKGAKASMPKFKQAVLAGGQQAAAAAPGIGARVGSGLAGGLTAALSGVGASVAATITAQLSMTELQLKQKYGIHSPSERWRKLLGAPLGEGIIKGAEAALSMGGSTLERALGAVEARLKAISDRRAAEDEARSIRDAQARLAEARKEGKGVIEAEAELARAREDVAVSAMERRAEKLRTALEKHRAAMERFNTNLAKQQDRLAERLASAMERARDRISQAMDAVRSRTMRAFDAETGGTLTPAEQRLREIRDARESQDMLRSVADAERELTAARAEAEPDAQKIADAEFRLARAREDITVRSLEKTADVERRDFESRREQLRDALDQRLADIQKHFTTEGSTWANAVQAISNALKKYGIDFKATGGLLGSAFIGGLVEKINEAAQAAEGARGRFNSSRDFLEGGFVPAPQSSGGGGSTTIVSQVVLDGRIIAESTANELDRMSRRGGALFSRTAGVTI
ncbi:MAG: phage tail tape measure protein [Gemmatimonadaceae bacterium]|nr:phage tail tape measure protein [Gemmatimonadaceae bacterium]